MNNFHFLKEFDLFKRAVIIPFAREKKSKKGKKQYQKYLGSFIGLVLSLIMVVLLVVFAIYNGKRIYDGEDDIFK